jgi:hypothetical protein
VTVLAATSALLLLAAASATAARIETVPGFAHVFVIIGENTDYSPLHSTNATYLMSNVRPRLDRLEKRYAATHSGTDPRRALSLPLTQLDPRAAPGKLQSN